MPIYAFACTACGHRFDRLQKLSDPDPDACPHCGSAAVQRQVTAPNFRLSGSGWYETDFKKDGDRKRNLAGEGGEGAKPPAGEGGSDSAGSTASSGESAKAAPAPAPAPAPSPTASKPASGSD